MLSEAGRRIVTHLGPVAHPPDRSAHEMRTGIGVLDSLEVAALLQVGIVVGVASTVQHRSRSYVMLLKDPGHLVTVEPARPAPNDVVQLVLIPKPGRERREPRVSGQLGHLHRLAHAPPLLIRSYRDRDPPVIPRAAIRAVRRHSRVSIAAALARASRQAVLQDDLAKMRHKTLGLGQVDELASSRAGPVVERNADREGGRSSSHCVRVVDKRVS